MEQSQTIGEVSSKGGVLPFPGLQNLTQSTEILVPTNYVFRGQTYYTGSLRVGGSHCSVAFFVTCEVFCNKTSVAQS